MFGRPVLSQLASQLPFLSAPSSAAAARRWLVALLVLAVSLPTGAAAEVTAQRVAVLEPDEELLRALSLALSAWGLETIRSGTSPPQPSQPDAIRAAARLAAQLDVEVVVWVTSLDEGSLLWVFDATDGEVTTRWLAEKPPFDPASAASVALSVKTALRASAVAPAPSDVIPQSAPTAAPRVVVQLGAGPRWLGDAEFDVRVELATMVWLLTAPNVGFGLSIASGSGLSIDERTYSGRYRELTLGGRAHVCVFRLAPLSAIVSLGGSVYRATLEGVLTDERLQSNARRVSGSVDLGAALLWSLKGGAYLGAGLGAGYSPHHRRYLVHGTPVFSPSPVAATFSVVSGVELF